MDHESIDLRDDDEWRGRWNIDGTRRDEEMEDDRVGSLCCQGQSVFWGVFWNLFEDRSDQIVMEWVLRDLLVRESRNCILTLQDLLERMQEVRLAVVEVVQE